MCGGFCCQLHNHCSALGVRGSPCRFQLLRLLVERLNSYLQCSRFGPLLTKLILQVRRSGLRHFQSLLHFVEFLVKFFHLTPQLLMLSLTLCSLCSLLAALAMPAAAEESSFGRMLSYRMWAVGAADILCQVWCSRGVNAQARCFSLFTVTILCNSLWLLLDSGDGCSRLLLLFTVMLFATEEGNAGHGQVLCLAPTVNYF
mmetsp:Transcript_67559/g.162208  ORF Transcript_67559/g.162208 Transcript_67559/m.162208 type:complete len:201 (+) Transcript_67559:2390-2992(+)